MRDGGAVQSAIVAPENLFAHEAVDDPIALAVRYCARLCANHGFADGNKRVATSAMIEFLAINGISVEADDTPDSEGETELSLIIKRLASHDASEDDLYAFIEDRASYDDEASQSDQLDKTDAEG